MKNFLKSAEEQLKNSKYKNSVLTELSDHLETKKEYFEFIGYDEASSAEKANEAMGDGEVIGQRLNYIHRKQNKSLINIIEIIVTNLLFLVAYPTDKSSYFYPFLFSVLILICNFANTAIAVKLKSNISSKVLIIASCTTMCFSTPKLTYPICNLIINQSTSESADDIYSFVRIILMLIINAMIFLPNAFNIYHCSQIKYLKNTKKQNKTASLIFILCLIMPVLIGIPAYPSYMLNNRICEEQVKIRDELIDFAYDIDSKFDGNEHEKMGEYLENSEYDFNLYTSYNNYTYSYCKGNWCIKITFNKGTDNYTIYFENRMMNSSQKYLFTQYETESALLEEFGEDEYNGLHGGVIGKSTEEIKSRMKDVNIYSLKINKRSNQTKYYNYNWAMNPVLYGLFGYDSYTFIINNDDICYKYDLTLD